MKLQYVSDIHLEFLNNSQIKGLASRIVHGGRSVGASALILAGDIAPVLTVEGFNKLQLFLTKVHDSYDHIIHVCGNHEYYVPVADVYKHTETEAHSSLVLLNLSFSKYIFLRNETVILPETLETESGEVVTKEVVVAGTTLWFDYNHPNVPVYKSYLNDYRCIPGGEAFIYKEHDESMNFVNSLTAEDKVDVLIVHHSPTSNLKRPEGSNPSLDIFYHTDIIDDIQRIKPKYCVHGHTHVSNMYSVHGTSVTCNPGDYYLSNPNFNTAAFIEV